MTRRRVDRGGAIAYLEDLRADLVTRADRMQVAATVTGWTGTALELALAETLRRRDAVDIAIEALRDPDVIGDTLAGDENA